MPRGVYQRTEYHRERLTGRKSGGRESLYGTCPVCNKKTELIRLEEGRIEGLEPVQGNKFLWVCMSCIRGFHRTGQLKEE